MMCPHCSSEIPDSSKFCPECGNPLSPSAQHSDLSSDRTTLLQTYIPAELAKRILSAGKQIESERRLVTVVFADVSGFTAMSEKLDAEEVSTVLNDCFKGLISIVYKYEGVIDKFIGDEIMAIFGAPLTHENDPERAVRCSIEMMEYMERFNQLSPVALPELLGLHISLNSGMVVAGNVGSDLRMNYSVIGDTVNLASRLKHVAERGEIVVSEDTFRIVSSLVNADEPRFVSLKGKSEPVKVYKILSLKGGIEPGIRVTQKSPIIGREQEIAVLQSALEKVIQKKEQRVFIRGEAGVGKTRLKLELIQHAKTKNITIYQGKCSSFEINTPYYLWTTLLKDILQLKADTIESETRKRLHNMLQILSLEKHEPYLATLLSLRYEEILLEEDQERKKRIFESLKEFIRALSKRKPSAFLLEDVHWIDRFSQDLLNYFFTEEQLAPAMFIPIFRDEYVYFKELIEKGGTLIDLNRLTKADAVKLMYARIQSEDVPANLTELIYKRSEGNPFFIEELVKTLLDKNVVTVKKQKLEILKTDFKNILPETVQGVIMARIDRLEEKLKDVLYGASVIGREFDKKLLKEVLKKKETVDPSLAELLTLELILEKEEAKELAYLFKHYLIQEVAYNTILQKKRRELHKLIALAIEKVYAEKLKNFYELLSFHYEKAEEWEKAADYLNRSGNKAREMYSKEESKDFYERKEEAKVKLIEAKGVRNRNIKINRVVSVVLSVILFGLFVWFIYTFSTHLNIKSMSSFLGTILFMMFGVCLIIGPIIFLIKIVYSLKPKPTLFEVFEDRIESFYDSGYSYAIPFSEIFLIHFYQKPKWNLFNELKFVSKHKNELRESLSITRAKAREMILPASIGFGSPAGEIHILKKTGESMVSSESILKPWKVGYSRERDIAITPAEPKEFYDQFITAYTKWKRANESMGKALESIQTTDSPKLVLRPVSHISSLRALLSMHYVGHMMGGFLLLFLFILIGSIVKEKIPPIGIAVLWYTIILIIILLFFFLYLYVKRKRPSNACYEFFADRLVYDVPNGYPSQGTIPYNLLEQVEILGLKPGKKTTIGNLIIRTRSILTSEWQNIALTGIIMMDIENPEESLHSINQILNSYQNKVKQ